MIPEPVVWLGVLVALGVSVGLSALLSWCGPVDRPRDRGMHATPTPTAGGLAMMGGTAAALLVVAPFAHLSALVDPPLCAAFAIALLHGLIGALDDVFDFGARAKLLAQVALALVFAIFVAHPVRILVTDGLALNLPVWASIAGTALWVVVVVNAVNFMDGSNGLIAGAMAIVLAGLGLRALSGEWPLLAVLWLAGSAAYLGFLPWNFPRARLFQGDAGALFAGALVATLAVVAGGKVGADAALNLFAAPIALMPLLTDVLLTLAVRARRRAPLFKAHRDHLFQRWLAAHGGNHAKLARRLWAITGAFTFAAMLVSDGSPTKAALTLGGAVVISVLGWLWVDRTVRQKT